MPDSLSTQVLVEQVRQGDEDALQELCRRYQRRVLAAVRLRLGAGLRRKLESRDIVQEVMIDALRHVRTFDFKTEGAFLHYLNRVVINKIRDEADRWNAQKRNVGREVSLGKARSSGSENPLDSLEDRMVPTPSKIVSLREDLGLLERAVDCLGRESEDHRDLIIAVKLEGKSYAEIAEEKGISVDAVRMRVKRAVLALTKVFTDLEGHRL